jgi:hypothetical protein
MKKILLPKFLLLFCICMSALACKKNTYYEDRDPNQLEDIATILDTGNPALDGCGWLIKVGNTSYSPDNLPNDFKVNNAQVKIKYIISDNKFSCGFAGSGYNFIHLVDIKR